MDNKYFPPEPDFSDAKVGDEAWSSRFGWVKIINTKFRADGFGYPILFETKIGTYTVTLKGYGHNYDAFPTLFNTPMQMVSIIVNAVHPPIKEKTKVKKSMWLALLRSKPQGVWYIKNLPGKNEKATEDDIKRAFMHNPEFVKPTLVEWEEEE